MNLLVFKTRTVRAILKKLKTSIHKCLSFASMHAVTNAAVCRTKVRGIRSKREQPGAKHALLAKAALLRFEACTHSTNADTDSAVIFYIFRFILCQIICSVRAYRRMQLSGRQCISGVSLPSLHLRCRFFCFPHVSEQLQDAYAFL